jgi:ABC-2 type transport system permease protein
MNQYQVMFGAVSGLIVFGVGIILGAQFESSGILAASGLAVLGILAGAAIGIISAAVLLLTLKSAPILRLYSLAASLLAGSIFSVDQLPSWARTLSFLIPHTYVINGTRTALMANPGTFEMSLSTAVIALVMFDIIFFTGGLFLFRRTLEFSRKMGTLGGH